jgi:acetylornithine deacetylase/succinyl-diaminopimelate desuccinylase-like protein
VAEFDTFTGRRYSVPEYAPAWLTDPDSAVVQACVAGLTKAGLHADRSTYGFCTNGSLTAGLRGVPTVGYGIGREEIAHTVDEYIEIDRLYEGTAGYTHIIGALLGAGVPSVS